MTRAQALTAIQALTATDLKTVANAALLAAITLSQEGMRGRHPNLDALMDTIRTTVAAGDDVTG